MRIRRLLGVSSMALVCGLGAIGGSAARPGGEVPGIPLNAQLNVVEHNVNVYGFFTKAGVNCTDFKGAGVPNSAVKFGPLSVLSHPENGRAGCLVTEKTLEFLKPGTIRFQITLTEAGAFTGTDTINDTAQVTGGNAVYQAVTLIREAMAKETTAYAALQRFKKTKSVGELSSAAADAAQAESELRKADQLPLPGPNGKKASMAISVAASLDQDAEIEAKEAKNASKISQPRLTKAYVNSAEATLARADGYKESALKLLGAA